MAKRKRHTEELKREAVRLMVGTWALGHLGTWAQALGPALRDEFLLG